MRLSVVIPAFNAAATIRRQLESLLAQEYDGEWEIVVADNRSTDATASIVEACAGGDVPVRRIAAPEHQGSAHARNVGVAAARGTLIAVTDADDVVAPGWVRAMALALERYPCVGGRIVPAGTSDIRQVAEGLHSAFHFLPFPIGANCAFRREVFERLGGFDVSFHPACDDVEFFWRAQLEGFELGYAPNAVVHYTLRSGDDGEIRQMHGYATQHPRLFAKFGAHGMPRSSLRLAARDWAWIVAQTIPSRRDPARLHLWRSRIAMRWGRARGSLQNRVLYL